MANKHSTKSIKTANICGTACTIKVPLTRAQLMERYPLEKYVYNPKDKDKVYPPFTPDTAPAAVVQGVALTLRGPLYKSDCGTVRHVRSILRWADHFPHIDPETKPGFAKGIHNARQKLMAMAEMLSGADVMGLVELAELMLAIPPDADDFTDKDGREPSEETLLELERLSKVHAHYMSNRLRNIYGR